MRFLILGPNDSENTQGLIEEIEKNGYEVSVIQPKHFIFSVEDGIFNVHAKGEDLLDYDIFILRGYNITLTETRIFAEFMISQGKTVIDETVGSDFIPSKLYEASKLSRAGLKYPKSFLLTENKNIEQVVSKLNFPVVVKPVYGQKGQGIEKFDCKKDLEKFLKSTAGKFLIQEYLKLDGDIRIFVVDGKVLGAMRRFVPKGDFRSNASLGADAEEFPLNDEIRELALRATKVMNYEIAGVDLAWANDSWYVIEVNSTPQWQKFKEVTGINPTERIIAYAIAKYNKKNGT